MADNSAWKAKIRAWRKVRNLTQKEASMFLSVSLRTFQGWEIGKSKPSKFCVTCVEKKMAETNQTTK